MSLRPCLLATFRVQLVLPLGDDFVGRGRYLDDIFIECLWRSLKQESIYLIELQDGFRAQEVIREWITFYNTERPHSALDDKTPVEAYWTDGNQKQAA